MPTFKDLLRINLGGKWYVRILKVCVAIVGGFLLMILLSGSYAFVRGFFSAFR